MTEREAWEAFERAFDEGTWKAISTAARDLVKAARAEGHVRDCNCHDLPCSSYDDRCYAMAPEPSHTDPHPYCDPRCLTWREGKEPHE